MKPKTAIRKLKRNEWKMVKATALGTIRSYHGLGKKWKYWTQVALEGGKR